jgi:hypothetical protein
MKNQGEVTPTEARQATMPTPSNGVGFVWIAFLMPYGGSWPRSGLD